ncbi:MAG: DUF4174 domain-containing protein [Robiginitalea sp.]|uniref:DUF4174 domain-containing protein n=1 Tax=Robiginitalea sp. TaxID=1902411 RepID=UPI003C7641A4
MRQILVGMVLGFLFSGFAHAQDLQALQWKNRVLLLYTDSLSDSQYKIMVDALLADQSAVEARKLLVYTVMGGKVSRGLPAENWQDDVPLRVARQNAQNGFGLELIGLDGGVKYRSTSAVNLVELWAIIDGMPMRRSELKNQGRP